MQGDILVNLFAISFCFWILFGLYSVFRVQSFIVGRYERETDLLNTVFFKEHAKFTRYLPGFLSSAFYVAHLMMCLWGWRIYGKRKAFRDIKDPEIIMHNFTKKEVSKVKTVATSSIVMILHLVIY